MSGKAETGGGKKWSSMIVSIDTTITVGTTTIVTTISIFLFLL